MIGKIQVTSSGYDLAAPPVNDPTLGEIGLSPVGRRVVLATEERPKFRNLYLERGALAKELRFCVVLAIGPKVAATYPRVKPGVHVFLKPYFGAEVIVNGTPVVIVKVEELIGLAIVPQVGPRALTVYTVSDKPLDHPTKVVVQKCYVDGSVVEYDERFAVFDSHLEAECALPTGVGLMPNGVGSVVPSPGVDVYL